LDDKRHWSIVALCGLAVVSLAVVTIIACMPSGYQILGLITGFVILTLAGHAMFNGNVGRMRIALISTCLLFSLSLLGCILRKTVVEELPLLILAFIFILFSSETMTLIDKHCRLHVGTNILNNALTVVSWRIVQRRMAWLAIVFSGCYMLTIFAIYVGLYVHSVVPFLGDASVYLVVATVSLALLVTFREDLAMKEHKSVT
jgi:hypothetical protein